MQTYYPFVDSFIEEINEAFKQLDFWHRLRILDPRNLPTDQEDLSAYGDEDLEQLLDHYRKSKSDTFKGETVSQDRDIDPVKAPEEWSGFKTFLFLKRKEYQRKIDSQITAVNDHF